MQPDNTWYADIMVAESEYLVLLIPKSATAQIIVTVSSTPLILQYYLGNIILNIDLLSSSWSWKWTFSKSLSPWKACTYSSPLPALLRACLNHRIWLLFTVQAVHYVNIPSRCTNFVVWGTAIFIQVWTGPQGPRRFLDDRHMKVTRLSALHTGRLYLPGYTAGTRFVLRVFRLQGHNAAEGLLIQWPHWPHRESNPQPFGL